MEYLLCEFCIGASFKTKSTAIVNVYIPELVRLISTKFTLPADAIAELEPFLFVWFLGYIIRKIGKFDIYIYIHIYYISKQKIPK